MAEQRELGSNKSLRRDIDNHAAVELAPGFVLDARVGGALEPGAACSVFVYDEGRSSQWNPFEADAVASLVWLLSGCLSSQLANELDRNGAVKPRSTSLYTSSEFWDRGVGVVTPHRAQQALVVSGLQRLFGQTVLPGTIRGSVDTVERFQGQQRDVMVSAQLPAHLPRVERIIEPTNTLCPCGCGAMTKIGEDVSERLDVIPAQWRVLVTRRPKYICRRCSGPVMQAHAPEHVVPGGLPTEAAIAHVIVSKFGDHSPFYRQAEIYARQGIRLDRATLGNWSGRACFHLQPIADHMRRRLAMADRLFMDETTAPVLDPGRGQTKKGYFWAIVSDDRGHSGPSPPIVLFRYASGRSGAFAEQFLDGFSGRFLQCDAYDGYDRLTEVARPQGPWTLVHCWSHLRRRFVKLARNSKSPIAEAAVRHIAQLYAVEAMVRSSSPDSRLAARQAKSAPLVAALKTPAGALRRRPPPERYTHGTSGQHGH